MHKTALLAATCAALLASTSASAAVVTLNYDITGTDWLQEIGAPGADPADPLHLNVTLTFDTSVGTNGPTATGLAVNSFTLPYTLHYAYSASSDWLYIGTETYGSPSGFSYGCTTYRYNADTFCALIMNASTSDAAFNYSDWSGTYSLWQGVPGSEWAARDASLTVTTPAAVPEPASWALMIAGLGAVGLTMRRRRTTLSFA